MFLVAVIFLFAGYFWRMAVESDIKIRAYEHGKHAMVAAIQHEVNKGYDFWIDGLHFIPWADKKTVVAKVEE
jgi:hypothetical protein